MSQGRVPARRGCHGACLVLLTRLNIACPRSINIVINRLWPPLKTQQALSLLPTPRQFYCARCLFWCHYKCLGPREEAVNFYGIICQPWLTTCFLTACSGGFVSLDLSFLCGFWLLFAIPARRHLWSDRIVYFI